MLWSILTLKLKMFKEREETYREKQNEKTECEGRVTGGGLMSESSFFLLSTLPAMSSSAHGGFFLNNPTPGFHHSFETRHVPLSNICLLIYKDNGFRLDRGNDPPALAFCYRQPKQKKKERKKKHLVFEIFEQQLILYITKSHWFTSSACTQHQQLKHNTIYSCLVQKHAEKMLNQITHPWYRRMTAPKRLN